MADLFADRAKIAPVAADSAAAGRQPDILIPQTDDTFQAIARFVQKARDRQTARRAPVREDRRRRHEPMLAHIFVNTLGVIRIVRIMHGDAGEEVLVILIPHQIAVG